MKGTKKRTKQNEMKPRRMRESSLFTIFLLFVNSGIFNFQPIRTHYFYSYFAHYLLAGCLLAYYVPLSMYLKRNENNKKLLFLINSGTLQKQQFSTPFAPPYSRTTLEKNARKHWMREKQALSMRYAILCCVMQQYQPNHVKERKHINERKQWTADSCATCSLQGGLDANFSNGWKVFELHISFEDLDI